MTIEKHTRRTGRRDPQGGGVWRGAFALVFIFAFVWWIQHQPDGEHMAGTILFASVDGEPTMDPERAEMPIPRIRLPKPLDWTPPVEMPDQPDELVVDAVVEAALKACHWPRETSLSLRIDLMLGPTGLQEALFVSLSDGVPSDEALRCYAAAIWARSWPMLPGEVTLETDWQLGASP